MAASRPMADRAARCEVSVLASIRARAYALLERSRGQDDASWYVDAFLIALILANVIAVIIESIEPVSRIYGRVFAAFELFSVSVFVVEYLCRVWIAVDAPDRPPHTSDARVRIRYALSPIAIVDLLAVLPFFLGALGLVGAADARILRVLRLLRLLKLSRYADSFSLLGQVLRENAANFATALGVLMIALILAASGIYLIEREVQPEAFGSIPDAMWWAFATLTTVGYGDVTPQTPLGKLFGAGITIVSIGIVALPAGLLASSFSARLRHNSEAYRDAADRALADGIVTAEELRELELARKALGLGEDLAQSILSEEQTRRTRTLCPTCGQPRIGAAPGDAGQHPGGDQ